MKQSFFRNPIILIGFILFLALVVGTFYRIMLAVNTHPGLVNVNAYNVGTQYPKHLEATKALEAKGYKLNINKEPYLKQFRAHTYTANLTKNEVVLDNVKITANFYRQLEPEYDFTSEFTSGTLSTALPRKGKWLLVVKAVYQDKTLYQFRNLYVNEEVNEATSAQ